ncbi:hypothetical protein DV532_26035 (plasmid) [Pseudomonas sp. Leaf58]|uniref:hypothetical protein n=1 Tax=Pseudomonas sp. Leaf58 TaxID=1736226 RepID=UPI0006FF31AF|nr:hypothetical protein [Pseudomonas sp. Leaf58]AYG47750.1 hypothetical protein DV532_26035 [Pseudomonas sp. Leaf58]KQN62685.1 hypothetical protein ASF02_11095 [Pseudomonas sp. Leaf58]
MSQSVIDHQIAILRHQLGDRVGDRLQRLSAAEAGWDGRDALPMNPQSLESLATLSQTLPLPGQDLAVFLEHNGNLVISWSATNGTVVDASLGPRLLEISTDAFTLELAIDDPLLAQRIAEIRF